jgi:hypothetical protein
MTDVYANLSQTFLLDAAKRLDGVLSLAPAPDEDAEEKATVCPAAEMGQKALRMASIVTLG